jgi:2-(1,2-epoxy-1,2-dihydrophenyl)acetyl-CoA isomerase
MEDVVIATRRDGILTLRLNRPAQLNALDVATAEAMITHASAGMADPAVDCLVVTGTGRGFSAGGDMAAIARGAAGQGAHNGPQSLERLQVMIRILAEGPKPVLMAVNGVAAGAGFGLALMGDISIAASTARFRPAFIALGVTPDLALAYMLPRLIGEVAAREALYLNREFSADEALAHGMVNRVVPVEAFDAEVQAMAERLAAAPRTAFGLTKQLMRQGRTLGLADFLEREMSTQATAFRAGDVLEGVAAFREKRPADFRKARR